ncbi:MAG: hypothetical protein KJ847_02600 [Firmicutes bacterium]|nr:hypothetical protein [Bacillota bacterium]
MEWCNMVSKKLRLKDVFDSISDPIKAVLTTSSKSVIHPGTKGDVSEYQWINWLKTYLPKRYCVDKGFVIDYTGEISEQQDIIIYDSQFTPYLLNRDGVLYVPAESVYAVLEVKQKISKDYIKYAGEKIASVRKLKRTSKKIVHAGGEFKPKPLHKIIGGIVTLSNGWKDPFGTNFIVSIKKLSKDEQLDIGCCIEKGGFVIDYSKGISIEKSSKTSTMTYFFIKLVAKLQDVGTVPCIDFEKYLETIDGEQK